VQPTVVASWLLCRTFQGGKNMRLSFKRLLTVGVVALGIAASAAGAGNTNNPKADLQEGNAACGANLPTLPVIGFVNFHRSADGATVSVNVHVKGAPAGATYYVLLYSDACSYVGGFPDNVITANSNGVVNANLDFTVNPSSTRFFASLYQPAGPVVFSDTPGVTLTP
jgi:hypothetical protein